MRRLAGSALIVIFFALPVLAQQRITKTGRTAIPRPTSAVAQTEKCVATGLADVRVVSAAPVFIQPQILPQPLATLAAGINLRVSEAIGEWYLIRFEDRRWGPRVGYIHCSSVARGSDTLTSSSQSSARAPQAEQAAVASGRSLTAVPFESAKPANWNTMSAQEQAWWLCRDDPSRVTARCKQVRPESTVQSAVRRPTNWNAMSADDQATWLRLQPKTWAQMTEQEHNDWYRVLGRPATSAGLPAKPATWNMMSASEQAQWLCRDDPTRVTDSCRMVPIAWVRPSTPANWNTMSASEQEYWKQNQTVRPAASPSTLGVRATAAPLWACLWRIMDC